MLAKLTPEYIKATESILENEPAGPSKFGRERCLLAVHGAL